MSLSGVEKRQASEEEEVQRETWKRGDGRKRRRGRKE